MDKGTLAQIGDDRRQIEAIRDKHGFLPQKNILDNVPKIIPLLRSQIAGYTGTLQLQVRQKNFALPIGGIHLFGRIFFFPSRFGYLLIRGETALSGEGLRILKW